MYRSRPASLGWIMPLSEPEIRWSQRVVLPWSTCASMHMFRSFRVSGGGGVDSGWWFESAIDCRNQKRRTISASIQLIGMEFRRREIVPGFRCTHGDAWPQLLLCKN